MDMTGSNTIFGFDKEGFLRDRERYLSAVTSPQDVETRIKCIELAIKKHSLGENKLPIADEYIISTASNIYEFVTRVK